jgi:hypothetical protein
MIIRAFFEAVKIESAQPPYDTLHLKIFYPAEFKQGENEQNFGIISADVTQAPFPVVIFFNGVNCELYSYQWLMEKLVLNGMVVIGFNWIAENLPGIIGITPGVDIKKWQPDSYGTGVTASTLPTILTKIEQLQQQGILAGKLDLKKIIIGGHSAGGRVAIESANSSFYPQIIASFAYGAHTLGGINLGYDPKTVLPLPDSRPLLLMGGTCDGVIANNTQRYGMTEKDPTYSLIHTFSKGLTGGRNDSYLVLLEGANHFSITYPFDSTTSTTFLDFPSSQPDTEIRPLMTEILTLFIDGHVRDQPQALLKLQHLLTMNPLIHTYQCK